MESLTYNGKGHQPTAHGTVRQPVTAVFPEESVQGPLRKPKGRAWAEVGVGGISQESP